MMESSKGLYDNSKPGLTFKFILFLLFLGFIFLGHAMAFAGWWYVSPKGFPFYLPRFWTNSVIPLIVIAGCLVGIWGVIRRNGILLKMTIPLLPAATIAAVLTSKLLYPISMRLFFLVPACIWIVILLIITWKLFSIFEQRSRFVYSLTFILIVFSAGIGAFLPWSQKSCEASTQPINQQLPDRSFTKWNIPRQPVLLKNGTTLDPKRQCIQLTSEDTNLEVYPVLRFIARSPDHFWTLFARRLERVGPQRQLTGYSKISNNIALEYTDDDRSILEVEAFEQTDSVHIDSFTSITEAVFSHLNSYTQIIFEGKEKLSISFSPCGGKRFDITAFDYPFGRPSKFAYLSSKEEFHVVQASNAEKGPFKPLIEPAALYANKEPLKITLYEGSKAKYNIILYDWQQQAGKELSPTAGWRVPVNAISFNLVRENPPKAFIHITLGDTSVGRGFDTVGHSAGIYRNHMIIERLD